ncbi:MAG: V-type ATPase subunit, partial [candidate division WOR-3 bacterium]
EEKLKEIEYEIEKSYFENVLKELGNSPDDKIIEHVLKSWIDIRNIIGSLLLLKYNIKPYGKIEYLKGGYVSERLLKKLSECENISEGLKVISLTSYKKIFSDGIDISIFERRFEESLTNWAIQGFIKDPLSIYVPVAYIFSKYNELVNLRIIAYGIDQNISPFEIKRYIFVK